jgi:hypothetical protein
VPGGGVEPPRAEARRILSPLRLPVPPSRLEDCQRATADGLRAWSDFKYRIAVEKVTIIGPLWGLVAVRARSWSELLVNRERTRGRKHLHSRSGDVGTHLRKNAFEAGGYNGWRTWRKSAFAREKSVWVTALFCFETDSTRRFFAVSDWEHISRFSAVLLCCVQPPRLRRLRSGASQYARL